MNSVPLRFSQRRPLPSRSVSTCYYPTLAMISPPYPALLLSSRRYQGGEAGRNWGGSAFATFRGGRFAAQCQCLRDFQRYRFFLVGLVAMTIDSPQRRCDPS